MTTDIFARPLFTDGEGITSEDLNDSSGRPMAYFYDQILASMFPREAFVGDTDTFWSIVDTPYALALTCFGAHPKQGSANNKIKISNGVLFQPIAVPDGTEPKLLGYSFNFEEVTIANGDASNPRVDLVQMKLEYVNDTTAARHFKDATTGAITSTTPTIRRRVKCTLSVKQGTPAASPVYPDPDAGTVAIAGVLVGTNYVAAAPFGMDDAAGAVAVIHDQRLPLGTRRYGTLGNDMMWNSGSGFSTIGGGSGGGIIGVFRVTQDGESLYIPCRAWGNVGRLISLDCQFKDGTSLTSGIVRHDIGNASATLLNNANLNGSSSGQASLRRVTLAQIQASHAPAAGPTALPSTVWGIGAPIWTNGRRSPGVQNTGENDISFPIEANIVSLRYSNPLGGSVNEWYRATFYIAEGM